MNWKFYCTIFCVKVFLSKNSRASESNDQKQEYDRRPNLLDSFELLKYDLDIYTYVEEKEPYFKGIVRIKVYILSNNLTETDSKFWSYMYIWKANLRRYKFFFNCNQYAIIPLCNHFIIFSLASVHHLPLIK